MGSLRDFEVESQGLMIYMQFCDGVGGVGWVTRTGEHAIPGHHTMFCFVGGVLD